MSMLELSLYLVAALGPLGGGVLGALGFLGYFAVRLKKSTQLGLEANEPISQSLLCLLLAWSLLAVAWSPDKGLSAALVVGQVLMVVFGVLGGRYFAYHRQVFDRFLLITVYSLGFSSLVVIVQSFFVRRAATLAAGVNSTGTLLVVFAGLALPYLGTKFGRKGRFFAAGLFFIVLFAVLATWSRGALLGFIGLTAVLLGFNKKGLVVLVAIMLLLSTIIVLNEDYRDRFSRLTFSTNEGRVLIWQASFNMIFDHLVVGIGPGTFPEQYKEYKLPAEKRDSVAYAHNIFLHLAAEYGIPASVLFLVLVGVVAYFGLTNALSGSLIQRGLLASFVGAMIHQQVDITAWNGKVGIVFWLLIGLIIASYTQRKRSSSEIT